MGDSSPLLRLAAPFAGRRAQPPFLTAVVAGNDMPRRRTLLRAFAGAAGALVALLTSGALVVGAALSNATGLGTRPTLGFVAATAAFGVLAGVVWLVGQRAEGTTGGILGPALGVATVVGAGFPDVGRVLPWGWFAATWSGGAGASALDLAALVALACVAARSVPSLLDGLRGEALLGQARRWQSASIASAAGDIAGAMGRLRARASSGRHWRAVGSGPWAVATARSDVVGALRTQVRLSVGVLALGLSGWLVEAALDVPGSARWLVASAGAASAYAGLGVVSDGLRHAVDATVGPRIYGGSDVRLFAVHALAPAACGIVVATSGALVHLAQARPTMAAGLASPAVLVLILVLVRLFDSAKGQPPPAVMVPVVTPAGDLSALAMLAWQLDAVLISALLGAAVVGTFTVWPPAAGAVCVVAIAAVLARVFTRRLRAL